MACLVLIVIITITTNIRPSTMKKTLLLLLVGAVSATNSFADALLLAVHATPYDRQMQRIRPVLTASAKGADQQVSLDTVNQWMSDLRGIPYGFTQIWKTPAETHSGAPADCKAKAVALYEKMKKHGATNVRLVIGHRTTMSRKTHAWLAWETPSGSYMLDPTFNYTACKSEKVGKRNYTPLYAFDGSKKYRAAGNLVAQN